MNKVAAIIFTITFLNKFCFNKSLKLYNVSVEKKQVHVN